MAASVVFSFGIRPGTAHANPLLIPAGAVLFRVLLPIIVRSLIRRRTFASIVYAGKRATDLVKVAYNSKAFDQLLKAKETLGVAALVVTYILRPGDVFAKTSEAISAPLEIFAKRKAVAPGTLYVTLRDTNSKKTVEERGLSVPGIRKGDSYNLGELVFETQLEPGTYEVRFDLREGGKSAKNTGFVRVHAVDGKLALEIDKFLSA
jgi:hypothetical protein